MKLMAMLGAALVGLASAQEAPLDIAPGGPAIASRQTKFDAMWVACYTGADHFKQKLATTIVAKYCGTVPVVTGDGTSGSPYATDGTPLNPQPTGAALMPTTPNPVSPGQMNWQTEFTSESDKNAEIQSNQDKYDEAVVKCNADLLRDMGSSPDLALLHAVVRGEHGDPLGPSAMRCYPMPASGDAYCNEFFTFHWAGIFIESCAIGGTDNGCMVPNYGDTADTASACLTALTAAVSPVPAPPAPPASGAATASAFAGLALAVAAIVA